MRNKKGQFTKDLRVKRVAFVCEQCGKSEKLLPSIAKRRRFCSHPCYSDWRSENIRGEKHPRWKTKNIKNYEWLHNVLRRLWGVPKSCEICGVAKPLDLANKTGKYNKDRENWYFLCRKCHMTEDGRLEKLVEYAYAKTAS